MRASQATVLDSVVPAAGDLLLMLGACGDASRFAGNGVSLAVLLVDAAPILRPDWLTASERDLQDVWRRSTLPHVSLALSATGSSLRQVGWRGPVHEIAGAPVGPDAAPPLPSRRFVLAAGPIGAAGQTRHLLLAWRRLMDAVPDRPDLVIAGDVGLLADDGLAQIRNSEGLGGKVVLVPFPSASLRAALLRECVFCIAMEAAGGWGRVALDAAAAGKPCLSARETPENAAQLSLEIARWLACSPPPGARSSRTWGDVAGDVLAVVSA